MERGETSPGARQGQLRVGNSRQGVKRPYKISVVLPVRNEMGCLPGLLRALLDQDFPQDDFEIIVADGRSNDGTREFVSEFAKTSPVRVVFADNAKIRSGPARNVGVRDSSGDFVVFLDGHCELPSRTLLRDTIAIFQETGAQCLCRPQPLLASSTSELGKRIAATRASLLGHGRDSLIYDMEFSGFVDPASSGASYRREVFDEVGMYDEQFDACEDVEFNTRVRKAGMEAYTDPRLAVYYEPRGTIRSLFRQMMRYGSGRIRLAIKHHDCISLSQFAPLILLVTWLIAPAAAFFGGWLRLALLFAPTLYLALIVGSSIQLAQKRGIQLLWSAPAIYAAIHLGLGAGMLREIFAVFFKSKSAVPRFSKSVATEADSPQV
jgi:succinoglycan biosynthesis protein ExoA